MTCEGALLPANRGAALKDTILEEAACNGGGRLTGGAAREAKHGSAHRTISSPAWEHSTFQTSLDYEETLSQKNKIKTNLKKRGMPIIISSPFPTYSLLYALARTFLPVS